MHQKICWVLFISYLVVLTYFMFFSDGFGRSGHEEYAYNLILFKEIKRFYKYRELLGMRSFLLNTVGYLSLKLSDELWNRDNPAHIQGGKF